jgi:hypothetical protein
METKKRPGVTDITLRQLLAIAFGPVKPPQRKRPARPTGVRYQPTRGRPRNGYPRTFVHVAGGEVCIACGRRLDPWAHPCASCGGKMHGGCGKLPHEYGWAGPGRVHRPICPACGEGDD